MSSPSVDKTRGSISETHSTKKKGEDSIKGKRKSIKLDTQKSPKRKTEEVTDSNPSDHKEGEN